MPRPRRGKVPQGQTALDFGVIDNPGDWKPPELVDMSHEDWIALDTETTGIKWWDSDKPIGISVYTPRLGSRYYPWGHATQNMDQERVKEWARRELRGKKIVGLNMKFDHCMLQNWGIDLEKQGCELQDVAHSAALIDNDLKQFNLHALSQLFLGKEKKGRDLSAPHMKEYSAGRVAERAQTDAQLTGELYETLSKHISDLGLEAIQRLENRTIYPTAYMERQGLKIDNAKLDEWIPEVKRVISGRLAQLARDTGVVVNTRSFKDMGKLCRAVGITPLGGYETDAILSDPDSHPALVRAMEIRNLENLLSKFLRPMRERQSADGMLRSALHQLRTERGDTNKAAGTITGRFSSSALIKNLEGVNSQQFLKPSKQLERGLSTDWLIRNLIVPVNGKFFSCDSEQIEYRIFAHMSKNPTILAKYNSDPWYNFHRMTQEVMKQWLPSITYKQAKILNFSVIYGASPGEIGVQLGFVHPDDKYNINLEDPFDEAAKKLRDVLWTYNQFCPEAQGLGLRMKRQAKYTGRVNTLGGRAAWFNSQFRPERTALNAVIQGGAADIQKTKTCDLYDNRELLEIVMRISVHDELGGDAMNPDKYDMIQECLNEQAYDLRVPILWSLSSGDSWGEC